MNKFDGDFSEEEDCPFEESSINNELSKQSHNLSSQLKPQLETSVSMSSLLKSTPDNGDSLKSSSAKGNKSEAAKAQSTSNR